MKEKLWTTTFVVNMLLNFIFYLVFYLPTVVIGTMAMERYHASASIAGILSGIFIVGGFIARLWAGNNMKRLGAKKLLYIGTLIYFLLTFAYFFVHSVVLLLILRLLYMDLDSVLLQQLLELWLVPLFLLQDVVRELVIMRFLSHYRQQLVPFYQCFFTGHQVFIH